MFIFFSGTDEVPELGNLLCCLLSVAVKSLRADSMWELGQYQEVLCIARSFKYSSPSS